MTEWNERSCLYAWKNEEMNLLNQVVSTSSAKLRWVNGKQVTHFVSNKCKPWTDVCGLKGLRTSDVFSQYVPLVCLIEIKKMFFSL